MGSAAAIFAGEELGDRVQGYILESPYRDLTTAVWNRTHAYLPPILDRVAYLGLRLTAPMVLPKLQSIAPIESIGKIPETIPILILAGSDDDLATPEEAEALYSRVKSHAQIALIEGGKHHGLFEVNPEHYAKLLIDFTTKATFRPPTAQPKN